ncbi:MAG: SCO family protein [Chitinophagaceae bacterium]|nr:SCO family protein [Chitinophagaceae bacterium]
MNKKLLIYTVFFGVLLAAFYVVLMKTTDFAKVKLPVLNNVLPFSFTRHDGKTINEKEVTGKVYVAEYFFTTCKGVCPKMNRNMKKIYDEFKVQKDFLIVSHTVDPQTDSAAQLKRYADSLGANTEHWWFLTGTKEGLYKSARESYLLDDPQNNSLNIEEQFLHTQFFALVDRQGRVRGIYDGLKEDEIQKLRRDINRVLEE